MSNNEIIEGNKGTLAKLDKKEIGEVIKPLVNEIHLFDSFIAGTSYIEDKNVFSSLKEGDKLLLFREDNKYDHKAIKITNESKEKLGYVPEKDNIIFSRLMDAGKLLMAKIKKIENKGTFLSISIAIYLVDY